MFWCYVHCILCKRVCIAALGVRRKECAISSWEPISGVGGPHARGAAGGGIRDVASLKAPADISDIVQKRLLENIADCGRLGDGIGCERVGLGREDRGEAVRARRSGSARTSLFALKTKKERCEITGRGPVRDTKRKT